MSRLSGSPGLGDLGDDPDLRADIHMDSLTAGIAARAAPPA